MIQWKQEHLKFTWSMSQIYLWPRNRAESEILLLHFTSQHFCFKHFITRKQKHQDMTVQTMETRNQNALLMRMEERNITMIEMTEEHVRSPSVPQCWMMSLIINTAALSTSGYEQEQEKCLSVCMRDCAYISMMFWSTHVRHLSCFNLIWMPEYMP